MDLVSTAPPRTYIPMKVLMELLRYYILSKPTPVKVFVHIDYCARRISTVNILLCEAAT